jgi:multiple sugar transport system permease protein
MTALNVPEIRRTGNWVFISGVALLVIWTLLPIYLRSVNALSSPDEINAIPKRLFPSFDIASLKFFVQFNGVLDALWNSVQVAFVTMIFSIGCGAPAGYALSRLDFPGKEMFRFLVVMTRAFPLPLLALPLAVMFIRTGLHDTIMGLALVHTTLELPFVVRKYPFAMRGIANR